MLGGSKGKKCIGRPREDFLVAQREKYLWDTRKDATGEKFR